MKVFLIGFMGCGKTHWGRLLAGRLQLPFLDLDQQIEEQAGKAVARIFEEEGEEAFRLMERQLLESLARREGFVMACGGGTPCFFNNIDFMKKKGTVVWLNCPVDRLYERLVVEKGQRPLLKEVPDDSLRSFIARKFSNRKIYYQQAEVVVQEDQLTLDQLVDSISRT